MARVTRIQGGLRRRFEQWAKNPGCGANTLSVALDVRMSEVAKHLGVEHTFGQSPFALARGVVFERELLRDDAARLRRELVRRDVLDDDALGFLDLRTKDNGGPLAATTEAADRTVALLHDFARGVAEPSIIAAATLDATWGTSGTIGESSYLIIDVLVARPAKPGPGVELVVGEVKTYPDLGGHTDRQSLAGARAQAGLYVHTLGVTLETFGIEDRVTVATQGFLVLSRPGSNFPSVRAGEDLRHQADRARRGMELLDREARRALEGIQDEDDAIELVAAADTVYVEQCLTFCELADRCHAAAHAAGDPAVLGDDVRRMLAGVPLERALELLAGASPDGDLEQDVALRLREAAGVAR